MAIFNQQPPAKKETPTFAPEPAATTAREPVPVADYATPAPTFRADRSEAKESLIASDITIEGKIEGSGHVRIAGRFKGDVNVQGDLTIEKDAKLAGGVRAKKVTVAGELEGNIDAAAQVDLLQTGVLIGDLKAGSLTVAAGSRMRGQVEFGWEEKAASKASRNAAETAAA
ncbi:MAG TPA: polymer-forming cytoskeletal protein [Dokdonella sp.]|nr:polymer-forming cytoskeletal protein [Dokdonella sp.]